MTKPESGVYLYRNACEVDRPRMSRDRVLQALATLGPDASGVTAEISRELVTLRGQVTDAAMLRRLEDAVAYVTGVETIHTQVVVAAP